MSDFPKVSVITPLFNNEQFIERTIACVKGQTYTNWELIIVDDCSLDAGPEIALSLVEGDARCIVLRNEKNSGPAASRNLGISRASGRYIAFLDADDQWHFEKLEKQVGFMLKRSVALSYTDYSIISEDGNLIKKSQSVPLKVDYKSLLKTNLIGCLTAMYDTEILGKMYMPTLKKRQDYGLWLAILKKAHYAYCVPGAPLATYTSRSGSLSSNKIKLLGYNWKVFRELEKLPILKSCYYIMYNIYYKLIK